jgi:molecular chaperone GrpE (heat shock protein)
VEKRVRGQLEELEEKHELMRRGLQTDEATVLMFSNDLIKRIDLIDILIQRYAAEGDRNTEQQLRTLRASFEDILHQHGVVEFEVEPGTEIDVKLRQRISVIESQPGSAKPKIVATCRPGFMYSAPEGREVVLRKVDVKTTSQ